MKSPILGQAYVARSVNAADNRMVNLFPEVLTEGKEAAYLQRAPGLAFVTSVGTGPIRGMWTFGGFAFVVSGAALYRLDSSFGIKLIGTIGNVGPVSMADNGVQLFIAANGISYIYNLPLDTLQQIVDPDFNGAVTVGYLDGYFVYNEPNSQRLYVTELLDGTSIDPTDFASAEGAPDNVVAIAVDHREMWAFGENSVEVWYNAGLPDFPLSRISGAFNEIGCLAPYSVAKLDNSLFWLGSDARGNGIVYRAEGYRGKRVSTHAVEWQIQSYSNLGDARAYTYQQDGHSFYVLVFPTANTTWVYDASTGVWHERAGWDGSQFVRHRGVCQLNYANRILIGDYENGNIYEFDLEAYSDNGQTQKWLRSWRALPPGTNNLKRTAHHFLQLDCETGVGLSGVDPMDPVDNSGTSLDLNFVTQDYQIDSPVITVQGANPRVMLRWSDDGGHTWSNEHWKSMGRVGEYKHRTIWRRLGMTTKLRDRVYEVSGTDPVKVAIMGAELILSPTNA
jgi:hypothetical protein